MDRFRIESHTSRIRAAFDDQQSLPEALQLALSAIQAALQADAVLLLAWWPPTGEWKLAYATEPETFRSATVLQPLQFRQRIDAEGRFSLGVDASVADVLLMPSTVVPVGANLACALPGHDYVAVVIGASLVGPAGNERWLLDQAGMLANELGRAFGARIRSQLGLPVHRLVLEGAVDASPTYALPYLLHRGAKEVAVLFADLRGSTSLAELLGREREGQSLPRLDRPLNEYCTELAEALCTQGRIDKFLGDGVMAVVGDCSYEPDDDVVALRAVCSAVGAVEAFSALRAKWEQEWLGMFRLRYNEELDPQIGIGVNFGVAYFDFFGAPRHHEYTCIGDTVNTAQRLESLAARGEGAVTYEPIVLSQTVYSRVAPTGAAECQHHVVSLRGRALPVAAYGLQRFDRSVCHRRVGCLDCLENCWPHRCLPTA